MNDFYFIPIVLLLPLCSLFVVLQVNPYTALVMRGILGAISALIYAVLGAADVSLTDALVGTMLSITLYAIAVRSSLSMKIGGVNLNKEDSILIPIKEKLNQHFMRIEIFNYSDEDALRKNLLTKEIHSAYLGENKLMVRVPRLYRILAEAPGLDVILSDGDL